MGCEICGPEIKEDQPTFDELCTALRIAEVFIGTPQRAAALNDLRRIRDRKTTWVGADEVRLRSEIENLCGRFQLMNCD